jgi:hypothetical protein
MRDGFDTRRKKQAETNNCNQVSNILASSSKIIASSALPLGQQIEWCPRQDLNLYDVIH